MNLPNYWYASGSDGSLSEYHSLYARKILIWRNFFHLRPFFGAKLRVLRVFDLLLPNAAMNLSNFWYGSFSNGLP